MLYYISTRGGGRVLACADQLNEGTDDRCLLASWSILRLSDALAQNSRDSEEANDRPLRLDFEISLLIMIYNLLINSGAVRLGPGGPGIRSS